MRRTTRRDRRAQVPARRGARAAPRRRRRAPSTSYRESSARADARGRAHGAAGVLSSDDAPSRWRPSRRSSRSTSRPRSCRASSRCTNPARREKTTAKRVALLLRIGELEAQARQRRAGVGRLRARLHARTRVDGRARGAREPGDDHATLAAAGRAVRGGARGSAARRSCRRRSSASSCSWSPSPTTRSSEKSEKAVEYFRRAQAIQPEDASALVALERLYTRTERWTDLIDTLTQEGRRWSPSRRARADPRAHRHRLGGDARQRRGGDRRLEGVLADNGEQPAGAARARSPVPARGDWRDLADNLSAAGAHRGSRRDRSRCSAASACCASSSSARWAAPSRPTARSCEHRAGARRDAGGARARPADARASTSSRSRSCSSRSTRRAATGRA